MIVSGNIIVSNFGIFLSSGDMALHTDDLWLWLIINLQLDQNTRTMIPKHRIANS